ncbi:SPX domain-containing protein [Fimicolochytrium jonesii]|uniref:SPX domain-containing protein n=1 Tax=Fimicolochytrium jonesii TaxID=1396493 RepID=UPI0022FE3CFC|nr:SPX domain-containing protein [Fimicolochytrium jonesii]KAI8824531.1 SPX domain-containing protein [Fimicolochytrium jonesii]
MKFSHSIQINASPEWQENYLAYSQLKKAIYAIEKAMLGFERLPASPRDIQVDNENDEGSPAVEEAQPLLSKLPAEEGNAFFVKALDEQLERITAFYTKKERELTSLVDELVTDVATAEDYAKPQADIENGLLVEEPAVEGDAVASVGPTQSPTSPGSSTWPRRGSAPVNRTGSPRSRMSGVSFTTQLWASKAMKPYRTRFAKRAIDLFILLSELKDYIELNYTGFSKIIKKYDKVTGNKLRRQYMATKVEVAKPFRAQSKEALNQQINQIVEMYATLRTDGKIALAWTDLKGTLRERVIWERNTVWKDMIEQERKRETIALRAQSKTGKSIYTEFTLLGVTIRISRELLQVVLCLGVFAFLLLYPTFEAPEQRNCLAILVFASLLWAFEVLPLFITAILVPFLVVFLRVLRTPVINAKGHITDYNRMTAKDGAKKIFSDMFGPVIMLLLGGFSLAAALSKHNIAKGLASFVLGKAGSKPQWVLLANMFVSTFASMWISNVAAPVLCFSLVTPILRNLPLGSSYGRCLIMGIAMAANVGGMASPISSPQNIIAIGTMNPAPSWPQWFAVSLPVVIIMDLIIWGLLLAIYRPSQTEGAAPVQLFGAENTSRNYFKDHPLERKQWYIIAVTLVTILLWCFGSGLEQYFGDMGVIAIIPIVAFYGAGLLTKDDWNSMLWSVVMLAMGGIALGKAVDSSGLLLEITNALTPHLAGMSVFKCLALFSGLVLVGTTFISHTVGALIILPIILKVGATLPDPRANTLVMAAAMMCSGAMGLPVSSFPNMNAISLEDSSGTPWVTVGDFIKVGLLCSVVAWVMVLSVGFPIMGMVGIQ